MNRDSAGEAAPAPWRLRGEGLALLYRFGKRAASLAFDERDGDPSPAGFRGGIGALILVDYAASPVGPYKELVFIPGRCTYAISGPAAVASPPGGSSLRIRRVTAHTISRIYVTSQPSLDGGRLNWGIPKGLARIEWNHHGAESEVTVTTLPDGAFALSVSFRGRGMALPFDFRILPHSLAQASDRRLYLTKVSASGRARLARATDLKVSEQLFPVLAHRRPFAAVSIPFATLLFPKATIFTWR